MNETVNWKNTGKDAFYESSGISFQKLLRKPSKLSDKNTYRLSVVSEIKAKVILIANQKKEKYPLRANENSKSIHLKAFPSEPLVIYV